ncbi:hypothetical protein JHK82_048001 [Glycine max]|nr:hypothetical protein JHK82_048001 [Glycine max]
MKKICSNLQGKDNAPPPPPQWIEAKDQFFCCATLIVCRSAFDMFLLGSFSPPQPSHTLVQEIIEKAPQLRPPSVTELLLSNDGDQILEGCVANFFVICCKERNSNDEKAVCDYGKKCSFQVQTALISDGVLLGTIRQLVLDDLSDLVEIIHKVVKLMDNLQSRGALRVSRKSRKVKKKIIPEGTESGDKLARDHSCIQNETGISSVNQSAENQPLQEVLPNANSTGEDVIPDDNEHENHVEEVGNSQVGLEPMGATNSEHVNEDMLDGTNDFSEDEQLHAYNEADFKFLYRVRAGLGKD